MGKTLVIVESPSKAKTIEKFLGKNKYEVLASVGHVRDLPKSQLGIDVENDFAMKYITIRGKGDKIKELKKAASKADAVLLAPDPDREGEAIAWHLMETLKIDPESCCRIEFNEITKDAVKNAVKHPRQIAYNRVNSQQARRVLDRFIGYQLSPLLWRKVKKGLSAGRVQSVTVRLICEREEEINSFIPEEYWTLDNEFATSDKGKLAAKLAKIDGKKAEIHSEAEMQVVLDALKDAVYTVADVKVQKKTKNPSAPFITSTLQQDAYRKLNFVAKRTMRTAQQLYEGVSLGKAGTLGLITYMRTDSTRISDVAKADAAAFIKANYGEAYLPKVQKEYKNKNNAQNAHEAIRPTYVDKTPESVKAYLTPDQYKLYKLIWERFVASQMAPAQLEQTTVLIRSGVYDFTANGTVVTFNGYKEVYEEPADDKEENQKLTKVETGQTLSSKKMLPKQHFTQPPARYTEASLIKALEELGIGRPSTYAATIDTILTRNYVVREAKQFYPTELGTIVVDLLKEHFPDIVNVDFTADMETKLDGIEEGEHYWKDVVRDFYEPFSKDLAAAEEKIGKIKIEDEVTDEICEKCGRNMVIKIGRFGKFLACPGFPACSNAKPLLEKIDVPCPECEHGEVVLRRSKKGRTFYGCSNYPECSFVSWDKPTGKRCPHCNSIMVERRTKKGKLIICSNKECNYEPEQQPDKQAAGEES